MFLIESCSCRVYTKNVAGKIIARHSSRRAGAILALAESTHVWRGGEVDDFQVELGHLGLEVLDEHGTRGFVVGETHDQLADFFVSFAGAFWSTRLAPENVKFKRYFAILLFRVGILAGNMFCLQN